jgi:threonine/homoserine/homoserine lactone efflux protein
MSIFIAMISFSFVMSITPGPVNMIILSSGVNHGVKKTLPYVTGATLGFTLLLLLIGLVFFELIHAYPSFLSTLTVLGSFYIVFMGYKIAASEPNIEVKKIKVPGFFEGFVLQWLNPKAWIACMSGATLFSSTESYAPFLIFAIIYFSVCYASLAAWAVLGHKISLLLNSHIRLRAFNATMGTLLIVTALYLLYGYF